MQSLGVNDVVWVTRWCRCDEVVQVGRGGAGVTRWCMCDEVVQV